MSHCMFNGKVVPMSEDMSTDRILKMPEIVSFMREKNTKMSQEINRK